MERPASDSCRDEESETMSKTHVEVTIEMTIHDPQAFWDAAYERLCSENGTTSPEDAAEHLGTRDQPALGRCAQMLIDPGISPAGCQIEQSSAEEVTTLPAEEPFLIREF